jgi:hypothetical protein
MSAAMLGRLGSPLFPHRDSGRNRVLNRSCASLPHRGKFAKQVP